MNKVRKSILVNGVRNIKEFGYTDVNEENIITDEVYRRIFRKALVESHKIVKQAAGLGEVIRKEVVEQLEILINEIPE